MKNNQLLIVLLLVSGSSFAQAGNQKAVQRIKDSITLIHLRAAALKYPTLRQAYVSREMIGNGKINAQLRDGSLYKGEMEIARTRVNLSLPVYRVGKHQFSTTINYLGQNFKLEKTTSLNPQFAIHDASDYKSTFSFSANYSISDSLFHHPVNFAASVLAVTDGSFSDARMNYLGIISFPLKRTTTTAYSIGLIINIDPASPAPAFPIFNYWHQFGPKGIELFVDMPSRLMLRKQLTAKTAVSLGSELGGTMAFLRFNTNYFPKRSIYTTLEIKSGATFEYTLNKFLVLGVNGGLLSTVASRHLEKNASQGDYFIKNNIHTVPYVNVSLSLLPSILRLW